MPVPTSAGVPVPTLSPALQALRATALEVLHGNDLGDVTRPSPTLYPHQWLWDSCFIAIGLRHVDPARAAAEVLSLLRGQWPNGMIPHVIFAEVDDFYHAGPQRWRCDRYVTTASGVQSTGITQPPMIAEAAIRIGEMLDPQARQEFYGALLPGLIRFHQFLHTERDPDDDGLVTLVHSWESGMDNTPPWMEATLPITPRRVKVLRRLGTAEALDALRRDAKEVPPEERLTSADLFTLYRVVRELRRSGYSFRNIRETDVPLVQDVAFNAILVRANDHLVEIAAEVGVTLPKRLTRSMRRCREAMARLWSESTYYSRDFRTGDLLRHETVGGFLPLYAGVVPDERVDALVKAMTSPRYWPRYGVSSVPADDEAFLPRCYWQGPVWININWLLADGLERYGRLDAARELRAGILNLISSSGEMFEYYSPLDGTGAGSNSFAWTAALLLDLLARPDLPEIQEAAGRAAARMGTSWVPGARRASDEPAAPPSSPVE